jgi:formylglycine-generating enzyme required for sulfatase activity
LNDAEGAATRSLVATYSGPSAPSGASGSSDAPTVAIGQQIDRYVIRRHLGSGGMGQVYLARDAVLGRSVALKIMAGATPSEVFLHEARAIAMLNHPNIVQLYEFGDHHTGMFLALEYVDGETLRDRLRPGGIGLDQALRHTRAIAEALAHAHAAGVTHCDLKPSNVMVGRDGRVRVLDFGIARTRDQALEASSGTPDWMAPEQWSGLPLTDRVDTWALGIVCAQLLSGRHPFGDDLQRRRDAARNPDRAPDLTIDGDAPVPVADLIRRSLQREPHLRPSAAEWGSVLGETIAGRGESLSEDGPYPGLAAFDEHRARFYFGREREVDELVERLRDAPHLPIVGPSGTGKSSFLHAGVIPRLRARERWTVIAFRPGADPVGALARHLIAAAAGYPGGSVDLSMKTQALALRAELLETPTLLAARFATLATANDARVLLAVDQLEEAFTQGAPEAEASRFLAMLMAATDDPLDPVRVVLAVRDDFVGKLAGLRSLFVMRKLDADALRRTITGPLARHGYTLDDEAIIEDLLREVGSAETSALPLLQFACRTLWEGRDVAARRLRRATYEQMGGLAGALAGHAERAIAALSPHERRIARQLLLSLVSGTTRRSLARGPLVSAIGPDAGAVLDRLLTARLLVQHGAGDGGGDSAIVEIAHESLLQTWAQLARWVDESRDERRLLEELEDATSLWERRGERVEETWSQEELTAARHRAAQLELALPPRVQRFLAAGEQRHRAQLRRRRVRYGMALAGIAVVAVPVAIFVTWYVAREHLIRANAGTVDIVLQPFDWIDGAPRHVPVDELPGLTWTLHAARPGDPHQPGAALPADLVEVLSESSDGTRHSWRVRAPGGMAFLRIDGRGRDGEHCAPSWIRIQAFPGYAGSVDLGVFPIDVPTCRATHDDMLTVEAGPFVYGGPGDPPSKFFGGIDYDQPERVVDLPVFALDRTEVSNARFAAFARLEHITGYRAPLYGNDATHAHDGDPEYPVTNINLFEADAFCKYMGKALPSDLEWMKAARGGLAIHGAPNQWPRRLYPWGPEPAPRCVNQAGEDDGSLWTAPVDAYACGAGPYGHRNLVGNVDEWIAYAMPAGSGSPLAVIRGGSARSPPERQHTSTIFANRRDPLQFDYATGVRCSTHDD